MTSLDADFAAKLVSHAVELAWARGVAVSVGVVDEAGSLLAFQRMQGAPRFSADFAIAKAKTAAAFGRPTSQLEEAYKDRPAFAHSFVAQGGYFLGRGGIPVLRDEEVVGAIGVSGADAHGEEDLSIRAVEAEAAAGLAPGGPRP